MIAADGVRVLAIGALAAIILLHQIAFWAIPLVAFVEGSGATLFSAAQAGASGRATHSCAPCSSPR